MFQIVEIHTRSGSQYTVITEPNGAVLVDVTRTAGHPLGEQETFRATDWHLRVNQGVLQGAFETNAGPLFTSAVVTVRQQIVKEEVYV
jgi:hypothetical protein